MFPDYVVAQGDRVPVGFINYLSKTAESRYHALVTRVQRRFGDSFSLLSSYTLSHARSNAPQFRNAGGVSGAGGVHVWQRRPQLSVRPRLHQPGCGALAPVHARRRKAARTARRAEAFNLANRTNYTIVGRILNDPTFGQLLSQDALRQWQFGARSPFRRSTCHSHVV